MLGGVWRQEGGGGCPSRRLGRGCRAPASATRPGCWPGRLRRVSAGQIRRCHDAIGGCKLVIYQFICVTNLKIITSEPEKN